MTIKRVHYISGITLTTFIAIHLFNHFMSLFGLETHLSIMEQLRKVYRNPFIELLILAAAATQILSGIGLVFSIRLKKNRSFFELIQIWSGIYLAFFLLIHIAAVLTGRLYLDLDTNIYFGIAGLNTFPYSLFFIPYYGIAIAAVFAHIASVHYKKMTTSFWGMRPFMQSVLILSAGILCAVTLLYSLTNRFEGFSIPDAYKVLVGGI